MRPRSIVPCAVSLVVILGFGCAPKVPPPPGSSPSRGDASAPVATGGATVPATGGKMMPGTGGRMMPGTGGRGGASDARPAPADMASAPSLPDSAAIDIHPIPPRPPRRAGNSVFHSTNVSMWEIHDPDVYQQHKEAFDEIIGVLERGYFGILSRLGTGHALPIRVIIEPGGCCGAWAGGGDVGYVDGNFKDEGAMNWIRGVVIGEVVNGVTGAVSEEWPRDWWADTAWYFPGFVTVEVLKEVLPAHAAKWERDEKYPTYPVYRLYQELLAENGWAVYQDLFAQVKEDKIRWSAIGSNPSAIKTNYVVAYLSIAANTNLAARFRAAGVNASETVVAAIMDAHTKLTQAGPTAPGWARFRMGDYMGAVAP